MSDCSLEFTISDEALDEPVEGRAQLELQVLRLEELPIIEVDTAFDTEAFKEIVPIQLNCRTQRFQTVGTYLRSGVAVFPALIKLLVEFMHIHTDIGAGFQTDTLSIGVQPIAGKTLVEIVQRITKNGPTAALVKLVLKEVNQGITAVLFAGKCQVSQERNTLANIYPDEGLTA